MIMNTKKRNPARRKKIAPPPNKFDSTVRHILARNPRGMLKMLYAHGYVQPESTDELRASVLEIIKENGEEAIVELLSHHPEKDILVETFAPYYLNRKKTTRGYGLDKDFVGTPLEEWVGGAISGRAVQFTGGYSNMDGEDVENAVIKNLRKEQRERATRIMIFVLILIAIIYIFKGIK